MKNNFFKISLNLKREYNPVDDQTWHDTKHIKSEIKQWLQDLDYNVLDFKIIKENKNDKQRIRHNKVV